MQGIEIVVDDSLFTLEDHPLIDITEWMEYHLCVKWYAIQAFCGEDLVGFMHAVKHPKNDFEWYFCDVHTREDYRGQGIASLLYKKAMELVSKYDKAYRITASVKNDNEASKRLHEKMGFFDTKIVSSFPEMKFDEGETMYEHYFVCAFPAKDVPVHKAAIESIAGDRKDYVWQLLSEAGEKGQCKVKLLWAGEHVVGYVIYEGEESETVLLPEWKTYMERKCLKISDYEE